MPHTSIVAWMDEIELGQLHALFAEQQIAVEDLPDLSERDLEKLGTPIGPCKRLMKAITALNRPTALSQPDEATEPVSGKGHS